MTLRTFRLTTACGAVWLTLGAHAQTAEPQRVEIIDRPIVEANPTTPSAEHGLPQRTFRSLIPARRGS